MLILGGYVIATPTDGPPDIPAPFWTISHCLLPDLPAAAYQCWFSNRVDAETTVRLTNVDADVLAVGIDDTLVETLRTERAAEWAYRAEHDPPGDEPTAAEFFELLDNRTPFPPNATILGHELVGLEVDFSFHSWHCFSYAPDLNATLNPHGLLTDAAEARRHLTALREEPPYDLPWTIATLGLVA
ncbi:hypothetical protein HPO96_17870 [Kribbella sandramycini]|uniref:Uncharacterized protein n=1 Tax=Kribbella sandramycini TaxID=60450 RepID=A0A7Y4L276_9ACTN|nr:hypothetical protein [Kribbella sandramycini]MBB6565852.1 hypothetical protein [Kribbella sandramycini]NOL42116.1 hypothetical protein [Kribbella sandramycini]